MTGPASRFSVRRPAVRGFGTLLALVIVFGGWGTFTEISGAVVASGVVEVEQNRQVVQHLDGGVVANIAVREAQAVAAGDILITLDGSALQSELKLVEDQLLAIEANSARLEAERDGADRPNYAADLQLAAKTRPDVAALLSQQDRLFDARRDSLDSQSAQLAERKTQIAAQIEGIDAQITALQRQVEQVRPELADQSALLDKGLVPASRVQELTRSLAQLEGGLGEALAARAQAEGHATEVGLERLHLADVRREEANTQLRDLDFQKLGLLEQQRSLSEKVDRLELRAPVSGVILGLTVTTPRSVIRPAEPVLYIVPQDRPLLISAQISPLHIDEVHPGQAVRVSLPALPHRTTPQLEGKLESVSADAMMDPVTHATYFRAQILLPDSELKRLKDDKLMPGMPVEAFIQTGARTPLTYLLKPFTDYFTHAFREQ